MTPVREIIQHASNLSGISVRGLMEKSRFREMARTRFAVFQVAYEHGWSNPHIGRIFGFDHSSVLHGRKQAIKLQKSDFDYATFMVALRHAAKIRPEPPKFELKELPKKKPVEKTDWDERDTDAEMRAKGTAKLLEALRQ